MPPATPMLAYAYRYHVEVPAAQVRTMMERHQRACEDAGPLQCQVTAADASTTGRDIARANLQFRATPQWIARFRAGLETEARTAGGRVAGVNASTVDLTRAIVDTDAALRSRTVLRDRLERLLAERPGNLRDVLELEREIARVQNEIDSAQSQLAVMRARVAMSEMNLIYQSTGTPAPEGVTNPLSNAFNNIASIFIGTLAVMLTILAFLAPWVLVIGLPLWIFRKHLPWGRKRAKATPPAQPAPPPAT